MINLVGNRFVNVYRQIIENVCKGTVHVLEDCSTDKLENIQTIDFSKPFDSISRILFLSILKWWI